MDPTQAQPVDPQKKPVSQLKIGLVTFAVGMVAIGGMVLWGTTSSASSAKRDVEYTNATQQNVRTLADAATRYRNEHNGDCPKVADLRHLDLVSGMSMDDDAWGNPFEIECLPTATTVLSMGPKSSTGTDDIKKTVAFEPPPPPKTRDQLTGEAIAKETTIAGVWRFAGQHVEDGFKLDGGKSILIAWGERRMAWADIQRLPETTYGKIRKDSDAERGKRLCRSGSVIEIEKVSNATGKYFVGGLIGDSGEILRFYALRSTGELVQGSYGRFCGVVTGTDDYENSAGGTSHGVVAIGLFDLPENKK